MASSEARGEAIVTESRVFWLGGPQSLPFTIGEGPWNI